MSSKISNCKYAGTRRLVNKLICSTPPTSSSALEYFFEKLNEVARLLTSRFTDVVLNDKECSERKFGAVFFQSLQTTQI